MSFAPFIGWQFCPSCQDLLSTIHVENQAFCLPETPADQAFFAVFVKRQRLKPENVRSTPASVGFIHLARFSETALYFGKPWQLSK
jgi:hypothetical protein